MRTSDDLPRPQSKKRQVFVILAFLALVVAVGGIGISWTVFRDTMDDQFQAALEAFKVGDLDTIATTAEAFRNVADFASHVHLLDGMLLLRTNRPVEAIEEFSLAKDHPETQALAYALSGEAMFKMGQLGGAEQFLSAAVSLDPSLTDAHRWLGAIYYDIGSMNQAMVELKTVATQDPEDPRPHRLMGLIYKDFEKYEEAAADYRESLRRDPNQSNVEELWVELAECLFEQTAYSEVFDALSHCSESANTKSLKAECYYAENDTAKALESVDAGLAIDPDHLRALRLKATLQMDADEVEAAAKTLDHAVKIHPFDYEARYQLARAYKRLGKQDLADTHVKEMERLKKLREDFNKMHLRAIENPRDVEARYQLGILARELGKLDLAQSWFSMTLAMDPKHEDARRALQSMANEFGVRQPPQ